MTTNIGSHLIQENFTNLNEDIALEVIDRTRDQVMDLLKKTVRPEFLNRVDEIIMFRPLSKEDIQKIVGIQFEIIKKRLEENNITLEADDNVLKYLGEIGFDPQFGARPLKRVMQRNLLNTLSKEILEGKIHKNSAVMVSLDEAGEIVFANLEPETA